MLERTNAKMDHTIITTIRSLPNSIPSKNLKLVDEPTHHKNRMQAESNRAKTRYLLLPLFGVPHPDPEAFGWGTLLVRVFGILGHFIRIDGYMMHYEARIVVPLVVLG